MRFEGETPIVYLGQFWHGFIGDPDAQIDIYAQRGFGNSDFVFQGIPSERKAEWKEMMKTFRWWRVTDIEWYTEISGKAVLCIDIKQEN